MSAGTDVEAELARTPLFSQVSKKHRKAIAKAGTVLKWKEGKVGVVEGSKAAAFFLILDGTVEIDRGGKPIARLREGDFLGESALLSGGARNASATAITECTMFALGRPAFRALVQRDGDLALDLLKAMVDRAAPIA